MTKQQIEAVEWFVLGIISTLLVQGIWYAVHHISVYR